MYAVGKLKDPNEGEVIPASYTYAGQVHRMANSVKLFVLNTKNCVPADWSVTGGNKAVLTPNEWVEVYSQDRLSNSRFKECNFDSCDVQIDTSNFINFDKVKGLSSYKMRFVWDGTNTLEWTQKTNPLDPSFTNSNLLVCQKNGCKTAGDADTGLFGGLTLSHRQGSPNW